MSRSIFINALVLLGLICGAARAELKLDKAGANYLHRRSAALDNHYLQYQVAVSFNKYLNPAMGLEHDQTQGEVRRYYVSNRFGLTENHGVVLRYNHLEYPDWKIGENIINLYWDYENKGFQSALGFSYHATNMFEDDYNDAFNFEGDLDQVRINIAVSYGKDFFKDKFGFRVGINNFNEFENFDTMLAYNELGGYLDLHTRIREHWHLNFNYEPRLIGISGGHPVLGRETWIMGFSWRD